MKLTVYICFLWVLIFACNRKTSAVASVATTSKVVIPTCIQKKIDSIMKQPVWNPPAEIYKYDYNGKTVYVVSAPCCDFFTTAVDENCNYVCAPSGGFTGRGDRKCADFFQTAKKINLVWKDNRQRTQPKLEDGLRKH